MGFFDKFIPKEITKPFTKVARKVIPKELRPALPFLAAAVPFMLPGGFALGSLNPALSRGIMSSLANIGTQQVMDPEGDINLVSAALAGLTGAGAGQGAVGESAGEGARAGGARRGRTLHQQHVPAQRASRVQVRAAGRGLCIL